MASIHRRSARSRTGTIGEFFLFGPSLGNRFTRWDRDEVPAGRIDLGCPETVLQGEQGCDSIGEKQVSERMVRQRTRLDAVIGAHLGLALLCVRRSPKPTAFCGRRIEFNGIRFTACLDFLFDFLPSSLVILKVIQ